MVNADGTISTDAAGPDSNSAGPENKIKLAVQAGSMQGFDGSTQMLFKNGNTSIQINVGDKVAPSPPPQPAKSDSRIVGYGTAVVLALFSLTLFLRDKKAAVASPYNPNLGELPFTIVKPIGSGGMGIVYEAIDRNLDRRVAVKRLRDETREDPQSHAQLLAEAKTVAGLHHPNIVDIHSIVSQGGQDFLVFELIEGKTVADLLEQYKRLDLRNTRAILDPVCRALEFAHERGVVHRDLKPANVMITSQNHIKVMDFGIARRMSDGPASGGSGTDGGNYQMTNAVRGTMPFLAPEAWAGVIRAEGDVYALGVMAYVMLSGGYPFPQESMFELKMAGTYTPLSQLVPGLPAGMDALIAAALEPDAVKRLRTPREFRERLTALT